MGIDIRKSPFQIECIHCAECIDACDEILGRLEEAGPDPLRLGRKARTASPRATGSRGTRERVVVLLVLLCYAGGLFTALAMRQAGAGARVARRAASCIASAPTAASTTGSATRSRIAASKPAAVVFSARDLPGRARRQP